jgi:hypothetical protein
MAQHPFQFPSDFFADERISRLADQEVCATSSWSCTTAEAGKEQIGYA